MSNQYPEYPQSGDAAQPGNYPQTGGYPQSGGYPRSGNAAQPGNYPQTDGYPQSGSYESFPSAGHQGLMETRPGAWKRLLGTIIDSILVYIVASILITPLVGDELSKWADGVSKSFENPEVPVPSVPMSAVLTSALIFLLLWLVYRVGMEVSKGATLGKMAIGARVRNEDGTPISAGASAVRNLWVVINQVLNLVPGIGSFLGLIVMIALGVTIGRSPAKQSFMDKAAKAIVVDKDSVRY